MLEDAHGFVFCTGESCLSAFTIFHLYFFSFGTVIRDSIVMAMKVSLPAFKILWNMVGCFSDCFCQAL